MQAAVKNMRKNLVVSKESAIFVMPKNHYNSEYTYFNRNNAGLLSRYYSLSSGSLARKSEGARSFCIYIIKLSDLCQRTLKAVQQRIIVPALHLSTNGKRFTVATSRKHSFPNLPNFTKLLLTANTGTHPLPAVCAPASPTSTRSIIRTWLSVGLSLPLWRRRRSPESTASASASRSRENRECQKTNRVKWQNWLISDWRRIRVTASVSMGRLSSTVRQSRRRSSAMRSAQWSGERINSIAIAPVSTASLSAVRMYL